MDHDDGRPPQLADVERRITEHVAAKSSEWFPRLGPRPPIVIRLLSARPACVLYAIRIGAGSDAARVVAKTRRARSEITSASARPRLRFDADLSPRRMAELEFSGLRSIASIFGANDPAYGVVQPRDLLLEDATVVMDQVNAATLRRVCLGQSRLVRLGRPGSRRFDDAWRRAGGWLRRYHDSAAHDTSPERTPTSRRVVVDQFEAYAAFFANRPGMQPVGDLAARGAGWAARVMPDPLPVAVGHSDFAPRNMFLGVDGRLTVFDPMPRWQIPRYEDLCRLVVGLRLLGAQVHTQGAAFGREELDRRERDVFTGYYGDDVPWGVLRCYELLVLLDKWSALVERVPWHGPRARLHRQVARSTDAYLLRQAERLLPPQ